ncbi:MAG: palindromic element RPE4 domain-containing protein [Rickettsia hoogstraalii]
MSNCFMDPVVKPRDDRGEIEPRGQCPLAMTIKFK